MTRSAVAILLALAGLFAPCASARAGERAPESPAVRRAFVTSTLHTGNLGGLAGADATCRQRATAAALPNPNGFVAWLSDSTTDAYCHVHGLPGTRATNCTEATLPVAAGPWVRVDGFPFAARIDAALSPADQVLAALMLDELGAAVDTWAGVWTGTATLGELHPGYPDPCADWTSTLGSAGMGSSWASSISWLGSGSFTCSSSLHLVCLETGAAVPLPPHRSGGALAFVTSSSHTGNLGGLASADAICRGLAASAGLPAAASFLAWLSDSTIDAPDRLTYDGPWIRLDGVKIADGESDLLDGVLRAPLNVTETGAFISNFSVWSGTHHSGVATGFDCADWSTAEGGELGQHGVANRAHATWTYFSTAPCSGAHRLYCFADFPAILFVDDYESANTLAWNLTVPAP